MGVQLGNCLLRLFIRAHLDEREAARAAGSHVAHDLHDSTVPAWANRS